MVAPVSELSGHITRLVQGPAGELAGDVPAELTLETELAELASEALHQDLAERSRFDGRSRSAGIYEERWPEASRAADVTRGVLASGQLGLAGGG
ncbi:MAG: hypothetical protein ACM32E_13455 [Gemmatimonadota bacterium]